MAKAMDFHEMQGDDISYIITITDDGNVQDITDWAIWITFKEDLSVPDSEANLQIVWGNSADARGPLTDPINGVHEIHLTNADTNNLNTEYYYDIQCRDENGRIVTLYYGKIDFTDDRTRSNS